MELSDLSLSELQNQKLNWALAGLAQNRYLQASLVAINLGEVIKLRQRESWECWCYVAPHPVALGAFVKIGYYRHIDIYDTKLNDWRIQEQLVVSAGPDRRPFIGDRLVNWANNRPGEANLFIPGDWTQVLDEAWPRALAVIESAKDNAEMAEKNKLLLELAAFGKY
jgi:hypothetical protein